jgi:hypothetical protein
MFGRSALIPHSTAADEILVAALLRRDIAGLL